MQHTGYPEVKTSSRLQTALIAVGGSLAAVHASALELGDVKVHSSLGQPLRASIAYALAPNEAIFDTCVSLVGGPSASGLPSVSRGSMIVTDGVIAITGNAVVNDPLLSLRVSVNCPYTPQLTREYMLFVDPADTLVQPAPAVAAAPAAETAPATRSAAPVTRRAAPAGPAIASTRYLVQPGDSLSEIAQRIENRPVGLWEAVNAIFVANPQAFLGNDVNMLKAGAWLDIPDFGSGSAPTLAAQPVQTDAPATADAAPMPQDAPATASSASVYEPADLAPVTGTEADDASWPVLEESAAAPSVTDLKPGDVILDDNNPFVGLPDTLIESPVTTSSSPNVPTAIIRQPEVAAGSSSNGILWWLGGALALVAGVFGVARLRSRFGSTPIAAPPAAPQRRHGDGNTQRLEAIGNVALDIADTAAAAQGLSLDADLEIGSGLSAGTQVDSAHDFAFATTMSLDLELPEEMSSGGDAGSSTDIIPPLNIDPESILESEVLPEIEDDYDMSVIVDATKMPDPSDITERDLEAIEIDEAADDDDLITSDYTVSQEADYSILEQDYEDEFTATQKLNAEIMKAAEDLALRMDEEDTGAISMASVHELDVTAQLQGRNDDSIGDDDDTGVNPTISMEADDMTVEMRDDNTIEMPRKGRKRTG